MPLYISITGPGLGDPETQTLKYLEQVAVSSARFVENAKHVLSAFENGINCKSFYLDVWLTVQAGFMLAFLSFLFIDVFVYI